jgi:hypothetical protein
VDPSHLVNLLKLLGLRSYPIPVTVKVLEVFLLLAGNDSCQHILARAEPLWAALMAMLHLPDTPKVPPLHSHSIFSVLTEIADCTENLDFPYWLIGL